jgi:signal peptidase I
MILLDWLLSKQVRHAIDACRQVRKLLRAQQDLLAPEAIRRVQEGVDALRLVLQQGRGSKAIDEAFQNLEKIVQQNLRPFPHPRARENIEVFLVTGAIVLAFRTFFLQPMAIPTGSAQPTLWGIVQENWAGDPSRTIPGPVSRFFQNWWSGISYFHIVATEDGEVTDISRPRLVFPFIRTQTIQVGAQSYRRFFSSSFEDLFKRAGVSLNTPFRKGDDILKLKVVAGDHLLVNRMVYNFRPPHRGETIVFSSEGMSPPLMPNTHYIKRLIAVPGDRVRIGNDRHVVINNIPFDAATPGFETVYGFNPNEPPTDSHYSGHVNGTVAAQFGRNRIAERFPDERAEMVVPAGHLLAFGDNTMNSFDGRSWGAFPQEKLVGRAGFVFWPITGRFGWGYR